jgi:hypothetical protein
MFQAHGDAKKYCDKFGLKVSPLEVFEAAKALHRAFLAGQVSGLTSLAVDLPVGSSCPHGFTKKFDCPECVPPRAPANH